MMYSRQGVFFKKKHRLKIVREIPSNVKHLCDRGAVVDWLTNCGLSVAISRIQDIRGVSHHFFW